MNPDIVKIYVEKDAKLAKTARGQKKNDANSTIIPQSEPICFEIEPGGEDYLELWVQTDKPRTIYIQIHTDNETAPCRVRPRIKHIGNSWKVMAILEKTGDNRPQGVNVTIGEDETEG